MALRQITRHEVVRLVHDKELSDCILSEDEIALVFDGSIKHEDIEPVLDIELAVYRCERVGFFKK